MRSLVLECPRGLAPHAVANCWRKPCIYTKAMQRQVLGLQRKVAVKDISLRLLHATDHIVLRLLTSAPVALLDNAAGTAAQLLHDLCALKPRGVSIRLLFFHA